MTDIARGLRAAAMAAAVLVAGCAMPPATAPGTMLGYGTPGVSGYVPAGEASDLKSLMARCSQVSIGVAPPRPQSFAAACDQLRRTAHNQPGNTVAATRP